MGESGICVGPEFVQDGISVRSSKQYQFRSAEVAHGAEHMEAYNNGSSAEVAHSTSPKCGAEHMEAQ